MSHWRIWDFSVIWNFFFWDTDSGVSRDLQAKTASMPSLHSAFCQWPLWGLSDAARVQQGFCPPAWGSEFTGDCGLWDSLPSLLVDSGSATERTSVRSSVLRKVLGWHAAGQLVQRVLKAGGWVCFPPGVRCPPSFHHGGSEPQSVNPLLPLVTSRRLWIFWTYSQSST